MFNAKRTEQFQEFFFRFGITLYGDCKEGRRPSFTQAASPEGAKKIYDDFVGEIKKGGIETQEGIFGAEMKVFLVNNGPVTLILERS